MRFQEGQDVWVYDPPLKPISATVRTADAFGYKCDFPKVYEFLNNKLYCEHALFARPSDWSMLVDKLRDDSFYLADAADKLEREHI